MEALGRLYNIVPIISPQVINNGADVTGNRVHLLGGSSVDFVVITDAGTAGDDLDLDLQVHTAATGGVSADLDVIDHYYMQSETTLDGNETWTEYTQTAASEITDAGGAGTSAEEENLVVIHVDAAQLPSGYEWVSIDTRSAGANNNKYAACIAIINDLTVQRKPDLLGDQNA